MLRASVRVKLMIGALGGSWSHPAILDVEMHRLRKQLDEPRYCSGKRSLGMFQTNSMYDP
jgi:hypothetical protein